VAKTSLLIGLLFFAVTGRVSGAQSTPTIQIGTKLVVVDVVVTDSHGNPVHGLKKTDFAVTEGGAAQTVGSFEEHVALDSAKLAATARLMPKLEPGVFSNYVPVQENSAVNILLLDSLNTPTNDQMFVRKQLLQYVNNVRPGVRIAIFGLGARLVMLQNFTSNPEILKRVISAKKSEASSMLNDPTGGIEQQESMADLLADQQGDSEVPEQMIQNVASFDAVVQSMQDSTRAKTTLDALNQLARYLGGIPGRKNLMWFSGSFPINILPDMDSLGDAFAGMASAEEEFKDTVRMLGRAQVAVYPIDARGLMISPALTTAVPSNEAVRPGGYLKANNKFSNETSSENNTMFRMADDTGGKAFVNNNGLAQAVESAIDAGSNYYTLTYTPTNTKWHGDYRAIRVKLEGAHGGEKLFYRRGYYADEEKPRPVAPARNPMLVAATHGAPAATQILFRTKITPVAGVAAATALKGNRPAAGENGPWRQYLVQYQTESGNLVRTPMPDGTTAFKVNLAVAVYDMAGKMVNSVGNTMSSALTAEQIAGLRQHGLEYSQWISVPETGRYTLRIVVGDAVGDKVGSVELPVAAVKDLPGLKLP